MPFDSNPFFVEWKILTKPKRHGNQYYIPIPKQYGDRLIAVSVIRKFDEFYKETLASKIKFCANCMRENDTNSKKCIHCKTENRFITALDFKRDME